MIYYYIGTILYIIIIIISIIIILVLGSCVGVRPLTARSVSVRSALSKAGHFRGIDHEGVIGSLRDFWGVDFRRASFCPELRELWPPMFSEPGVSHNVKSATIH